MAQLTAKQIEQVNTFVQGYVQYDDVRVEVVNELALEIGRQMDKKPDESFGKALWELGHDKGKRLKAHIEVKKKELQKFWIKKMRRVLLDLFFSYKMLIVVVLFLTLFFLCQLLSPWIILVPFIVMTIFFDVFGMTLGAKEISEAEFYSFLASETYSRVLSWFFLPFTVFFLFIWFKVDDFNDEYLKYFVAFLGSFGYFMRLLGKAFGKELEEYYEQFPILNAKRKKLEPSRTKIWD